MDVQHGPHDPHEIDLSVLFPSLPPDKREEMRDFLDDYCQIAIEIFERLERDGGLVDGRPDDS